MFRLQRNLVAIICMHLQKSRQELRTFMCVKKRPYLFFGGNPVMCRIDQPTLSVRKKRNFWGVSVAFNQVDKERVRLAGPDRTAAEWVLRNGGSIKWKDSSFYLHDYNLLPSTNFKSYKIEEIDLTATDVIGIGFQHLEDLQHVKSVKLHGCRMIMDDAIENLRFIKDTLELLQISRCPMITDEGLQHLQVLKKLKTFVIYDLIEVKNLTDSVSRLGAKMAWCHINSKDPLDQPEDETDRKD